MVTKDHKFRLVAPIRQRDKWSKSLWSWQ